jgi:hypothetical protein
MQRPCFPTHYLKTSILTESSSNSSREQPFDGKVAQQRVPLCLASMSWYRLLLAGPFCCPPPVSPPTPPPIPIPLPATAGHSLTDHYPSQQPVQAGGPGVASWRTYRGTYRGSVYVRRTTMLCHNFLIGKGHRCALRTTCFGRIHGSQLREGANAGQHTPTLSLQPSPLPQWRGTYVRTTVHPTHVLLQYNVTSQRVTGYR